MTRVGDDDGMVARFRAAFRADVAGGGHRPLAEYLARFPGRDDVLAAEYARLEREDAAATKPSDEVRAVPVEDAVSRLAAGGGDEPDVRGEIGRGGVGVVYRVRDETLGRDLAMKVLLAQDRAGLARFFDEARVTAQLDHPGVVPVHRLGVDSGGRVFFTMKEVRGRSLAVVFDLARRNAGGWTPTRALEALIRICETLAFAHSRSVVHRDLKPSNVMVGEFGEVYVMDWGLAKRLDAADDGTAEGASPGASLHASVAGGVVGTPLYMAPEQAAGRSADVDRRADVYAVGAMLYELLGGRPPYFEPGVKRTLDELLSVVNGGPPRPIDELAPDAPEELRAITARAMARDPAGRYATAAALRDDLRRFLEGRVVLAHRTGAWAELTKWTRRNPALAASIGGIAALVVAASVEYARLAAEHSAELRIERDSARAAEAQARDAARVADGLRLAALAPTFVERSPAVALDVALEAAARAPGPEARSAAYAALDSYRGVKVLYGHEGYVRAAVWSADGARLLSTTAERRESILWDPARGAALRRIDDHRGALVESKFGDGGRMALTASDDGVLRTWDAADGAPIRTIAVVDAALVGADVEASGPRVVAAASDGVLRLFDGRTGAESWTARPPGGRPTSVRFSRDGARLVTSAAEGDVVVLDSRTGGVIFATRVVAATPSASRGAFAAFGPAGRRIVVECGDPFVHVLDASDGAERRRVAFLAGASLVGEDRLLFGRTHVSVTAPTHWQVVDLDSAADPRDLPGLALGEDPTASDALHFHNLRPSADGTAAAAFFANTATVIDVATAAAVDVAAGHDYRIECAALDPSGTRLATASRDQTVRVWDLASAGESRGLACAASGRGRVVAVSPDATRAVVAPGRDVAMGRMSLVDTESGAVLREFGPPACTMAQVSDDLRHAVFAIGRERCELWDVEADRVARTIPWAARAVFSPDSRRVFAIDPVGRKTFVVDLGGEFAEFPLEPGPTFFGGVASDGSRYGLCGGYSHAVLRDAADGKDTIVPGHGGMVVSTVPSPDGARLATYAMDGVLRMFDARDLRLEWSAPGLPRDVRAATFSPDGRFVSADRFVFESATGAPWATLPLRKDESVRGFTPDGRWIVTMRGRTLKRWPVDAVAFARSLALPEINPVELEFAGIGDAADRAALRVEFALRHPRALPLVTRANERLDAGDAEGALALAREALAVRPRGAAAHWAMAQAFAVRAASRPAADREADVAAAIAAARAAADLSTAYSRAVIRNDPRFSVLAGDPRFAALLDAAYDR